MTRMSRCWLIAVLGVPLGVPLRAVGGEPPHTASEGGRSAWPQIVRPEASAADNCPGPKVYYFDASAPAAHGSGSTAATEPADGMRSGSAACVPVASRSPDRHVRRAAAQPASLDFEDGGALPIDAAPPQPPMYDSPSDRLPLPYDQASPEWSPGPAPGLGGIPTFTHDYCPTYGGDPWQGYCCQRWRRHCGQMYQTPADLGEAPTSCCRSWEGLQTEGEAPVPPPELPAVVPDAADSHTSVPSEESPAPTKRRPPRNELPKAPK